MTLLWVLRPSGYSVLAAAVASVGDDSDEAQRYKTADPCFGARALQNAQKRSWKDQLSYERRCAYRKWVSIVSSNSMAFEVARLQILSGPMQFAKGGLAESIADSLGNKVRFSGT